MATPSGLPRPSAAAPPAIPQPGPAPPGLSLARWHYVDERHQHEVHAGIRHAPRTEFVVREMTYGNADPAQVVESAYPVREAWEAKAHHLELEARLAMLGTYWRWDAQQGGGWTKVRSLGAVADLRPVQDKLLDGALRIYHFHHRATGEEALILEIPRETGHAMLARLDFRWPDAEKGGIRILARDVPTPLARSLLAREHLDLQNRGYEKLVFTQDFLRAHSVDWRAPALVAYQTFIKRLSEGRLERPRAGDAGPLPIDSTYTDFLASLQDPRVVALHARFLAPGEEDELLRGGEVVIKRAIAKKRAAASSGEQILLNVLEASLLARHGLRPGQRAQVDPEVAALVRRFAYYL